MREVKFRVWSEIGEPKMIEWDQLKSGNLNDLQEIRNQWYVMQFTGLHDKNGVEIYEGDICNIRRLDEKKYIIAEVTITPERGILYRSYYSKKSDGDFYSSGQWQILSSEVIGNIHQNPELL